MHHTCRLPLLALSLAHFAPSVAPLRRVLFRPIWPQNPAPAHTCGTRLDQATHSSLRWRYSNRRSYDPVQ
uniref:Putative secreted protein n=1 Tax=Anopheles triannulatus TaxID=58253 RepID=A0A2M4B5C5_9DIPT